MPKKKKGSFKDDRDYDSDPDFTPSDDEDVKPSPPAPETQADTEFKLLIESGSDDSNHSSDDDSRQLLARDQKRRRSDARAQGKSHDLERKARGDGCMAKSPPRKKQMTKVSVETKLYQGQRDLTLQAKTEQNEKKEKELLKEQRRLDREKKRLEREKERTAKQAEKEAKKHWSSTARDSKLSTKHKPFVKSHQDSDDSEEDTDGDDSVEFVGTSPVASKSASRLMSAKAGTLKDAVKPDEAESSVVKGEPKTVVSGNKLLDEIKKDALNQSRAVKRHNTNQTKELLRRFDNQDILLRELQESVTSNEAGETLRSNFSGLGQHQEMIERMSAQDGILNDLQQTPPKMVRKIGKTVNDIYDIVKQCPHKPTPSEVASLPSISSTETVSTSANNNTAGQPINPTINVAHRHQYFQHAHTGPTTDGSGAQINHASATSATQINSTGIRNPHARLKISAAGKENLLKQDIQKKRIKPTHIYNPNHPWPNNTGTTMPPPPVPQPPVAGGGLPPPPPPSGGGGFPPPPPPSAAAPSNVEEATTCTQV